MACTLRVSGENFVVDDFLSRTGLEVENVWHKGDAPLIPSRPPCPHSGFNLCVSEADFNDLPRQIKDAIEFLKCNPDDFLTKLKETPGIDDATLDFGLAFKHDVAAQFDSFPPELLRLAGAYNIGIEVSHYWISENSASCNVEIEHEQ